MPPGKPSASPRLRWPAATVAVFTGLLLLHYPFLRLPYFWDEAGYYVPAALDFYRKWLLVPESTLPTGHTPLVMVYLGVVWQVFGFSPLVTRAAMILVAAGTVVAAYVMGRRVMAREPAAWSALLLALSPLFFAQSSLVHLDLPAGLFTTLAVLALMRQRWVAFAVTASLAVLSKETAIVLLPVAWLYVWRRTRAQHAAPLHRAMLALTIPILPLVAWTAYYHHVTGFWTGNAEYLDYNLYSALDPLRVFLVLLRRLYQLFIGGFNWMPVLGAVAGLWWGRRSKGSHHPSRTIDQPSEARGFLFLALGLCAAYVLMHSFVGGAILRRYLLPIWPLLFLALAMFIWRLPRLLARSVCVLAAVCFVIAWSLKPPYPFPWEDNLAYADFVRLHQQGARFLEAQAGERRILTAWPASDELNRPFLGYVRKPLRVVPIRGFTAEDFGSVEPESFDLIFLYSRKWEPHHNLLTRFPWLRAIQKRHFDYAPQVHEEDLVARYNLKLLDSFERRGQWVRIYSRQ